MSFNLAATLFAVVSLFGVCSLGSLLLNIVHARATNIPYVILPCSLLGTPWLLCQLIARPLIGLLPTSWANRWLPLLLFDQRWH